MPTAASVKLLYDETQQDGNNELATWSVAPTSSNKSRRGTCLALLVALVMFLVGIAFGAFLHAFAFSEGQSPFDLLASFSENSTNSDDSDSSLFNFVREDVSEEEDKSVTCEGFPWNSLRLPRQIEPIMYNVTIHPNISTHVLLGSVVLNLKTVDSTSLIVLHADRLNLSSFYISLQGVKLEAKHLICDELTQWAFVLQDEIPSNSQVVLAIEYSGEVRSDLQGLYISTHTNTLGEKSESAVTQFEPSYARKMLPCFDEPNFKATFELSIVRESQHTVRSNMNIRNSVEYADGLYMDVFEESVKMSTYLLAVAVLENYDYVKRTTRNTKNIIEVRLYAPEDMLEGQSEFGLDTAIRALEYFEEYFNIPYPLDKIDLLALDDFSEGAMENWGLVTFRDSTLLYSPQNTSSLSKEHIALVVCHEIAHQWFGNLVTMDWWNDLWLNEGFANYMEYRCVDQLFPDWKIMTRFYVENVAFSQEPDGLQSSRAISAPLKKTNNNIMSLFDAISYHKAAAIIHMIQSLAGEENFRKALMEYLEKYAYGNANGAQLWSIVEKHAQLPENISLNSLAASFTSQVGYPVIYISIEDGEIVAHNQTRFFFKDSLQDNHTEWPIPIHYKTNENEVERIQWFRPEQDKATWVCDDSAKWVMVNTGGVAYIKVQYDEDIYKELSKQLIHNHKVLSPVDRAMILVDAFDFSKTSKMEIDTYMELLQYAEDEDDRMAWTLIGKHLKTMDNLLEESSFTSVMGDFERSLIMKAYEKFAWKDDANKGLQLELIQMACRLQIRDCTKRAMVLYNNWMQLRIRPEPELIGVVLEEGIKQGGIAAWERALTAFNDETSPSEKQHLLTALASTTDTTLVTRLLRMCTEKGPIRPNLVPRVLSALTNNDAAKAHTWRFFRLHYHDFVKVLGDGSSLLLSAVRSMAERLSTQNELNELKSFLNDKKLHSSQSKLDQVYEQIELNIQWRRLNEQKLKYWLEGWDDRRRTIYRRRKHAHHKV